MLTPSPNSASAIIASAPLGAIIRFSDGELRPPARFTRKVRDWENRNATGRLTEKDAGRDGRDGSFALHLGDFGDGSIVILSCNRIFTSASRLAFTLERQPQPGEARVLTEFAGRVQLRHLAASEADARAWLERHAYSNARIEVVADAATAAAA